MARRQISMPALVASTLILRRSSTDAVRRSHPAFSMLSSRPVIPAGLMSRSLARAVGEAWPGVSRIISMWSVLYSKRASPTSLAAVARASLKNFAMSPIRTVIASISSSKSMSSQWSRQRAT